MWNPDHRTACDRRGLRYPSDLTDAEWALVAPLIPPAKRGGRPTTAIIDSQTARGAVKGGLRSTRPAMTLARRCSVASATC